MNTLKEIENRLKDIDNEDTQLYNEINQLHFKRETLSQEEKQLNQELRKLKAIESNSMSADWFLDQHKEMQYKGKANGKTDTFEGKLYANCNTCKLPLELFEGNTGIGGYVIGVCPNCKTEIDFTDVGNW